MLSKRCYDKDGKAMGAVCYDVRISTLGSVAIIIADIILLYFFYTLDNIFLAIGSVGILTFIGVLTLADYVSVEKSVSTGEMRSAMAASITVVYLVIIAFAVGGKLAINSDIRGVIEHFTWVVGAVIVFYFGSKAVLQYVDRTKPKV
ncbi:MAG: hypothetical protein ACRD9Q_09435 [Nitrososphaeraceae archaeon]